MKKFLMAATLTLISCALTLPAFAASPSAQSGIVVVDTARIFSQSTPGKAGEEHLSKVRQVLQKGMDDLQALYKGKEETAEAQAALRDGFMALERQMGLERQAVLKMLNDLLVGAVKTWRAANKRYTAVMNRELMLDADAGIDVTDAVMKEMNKLQPKFADLPSVTVNPPKDTQKDTSK